MPQAPILEVLIIRVHPLPHPWSSSPSRILRVHPPPASFIYYPRYHSRIIVVHTDVFHIQELRFVQPGGLGGGDHPGHAGLRGVPIQV